MKIGTCLTVLRNGPYPKIVFRRHVPLEDQIRRQVRRPGLAGHPAPEAAQQTRHVRCCPHAAKQNRLGRRKRVPTSAKTTLECRHSKMAKKTGAAVRGHFYLRSKLFVRRGLHLTSTRSKISNRTLTGRLGRVGTKISYFVTKCGPDRAGTARRGPPSILFVSFSSSKRCTVADCQLLLLSQSTLQRRRPPIMMYFHYNRQ